MFLKKKTVWLLAFVFLVFSVLAPYTSAQGAVKKPKLNVKKLNMTLGNNFRLRVYNLKKKHTVTYTSSNTAVVSVNSKAARGKTATVNALSTGSSTIHVTVRRGKKLIRRLKCRVQVTPVAFSIKFPKRAVRMKLSDRFHLDPIIKPNTSSEQPIFESDNPDIASVSAHGVVTALSLGKTTITATLLSSGFTAKCTIEVRLPRQDEEEKTEKPSRTEKPSYYEMRYEKKSLDDRKEYGIS